MLECGLKSTASVDNILDAVRETSWRRAANPPVISQILPRKRRKESARCGENHSRAAPVEADLLGHRSAGGAHSQKTVVDRIRRERASPLAH